MIAASISTPTAGASCTTGTWYWYGEHKVRGDAGNRAEVGVRAYSSKDLYNWKNEGVVLHVSDDDTSDITRGCIIERPKVVYNAKTQEVRDVVPPRTQGPGI